MSSNIEFVNNGFKGGFLDGFVESSVEIPTNGRNENKTTMETMKRVNGEKTKVRKMNEWDGMRMRERLDTVMKEKNDDSMMEYDIETGRECGVLKKEEKCYVLKSGDEGNQVVVADLKTHIMRVYDGDDWKESEQDGVGCIDLNVNGKRWEGGVKDEKPFGYGVLYDEEGRKEYEGFMMDGVKMGYGIEYYNDIERIEYEGCFYEGKRFGKGVLYDRNGIIEYNGLWKNDSTYCDQFDGNTIDCHTESVSINDDSFNEVKSFIHNSFLYSLKWITIGDSCFGKVRVFELDGLSELESVIIGQKSITYAKYDEAFRESKRTDGSCRIVNCPKLKSIQIGGYSFSDYHSFELNNLPSLQSIDMGNWGCFIWAPSFSLTGLIDELV